MASHNHLPQTEQPASALQSTLGAVEAIRQLTISSQRFDILKMPFHLQLPMVSHLQHSQRFPSLIRKSKFTVSRESHEQTRHKTGNTNNQLKRMLILTCN